MWRSLGGFGAEAFDSGEPPSREALRASFDALDTDTDGQISSSELLLAIQQGFGAGESEEAARVMIRAADADGDGLINFDEFCGVLEGPLGRGASFTAS